jgi:hypothetical protein
MTDTTTEPGSTTDPGTGSTEPPGSAPPSGQPSDDGAGTGGPSGPGTGQPAAGGTGPGDDGKGKGNSEAARYRTERNAERDRADALAERVTGYQRAQVERLAGDKLADATDLWSSADLADLLDGESGEVDDAKVTAAVEQLVQAKPHYAKQARRPRPDPSQGGGGGGAVSEPRMGAIFSRPS